MDSLQKALLRCMLGVALLHQTGSAKLCLMMISHADNGNEAVMLKEANDVIRSMKEANSSSTQFWLMQDRHAGVLVPYGARVCRTS